MFSANALLRRTLILGLTFPALAHAGAPEVSSLMRLGQASSAPQGFVEFCQREPEECSDPVAAPHAPNAATVARVVKTPMVETVALAVPPAISVTRAPGASVVTAAIDDTANLRSGAFLMKQKAAPPRGALVDWSRALRRTTYFTLDLPPTPTLSDATREVATSPEVTAGTVTRIDLSDAMAQLRKMRANGEVTATGRTRLVAGPPQLTPALWKQISKVNDKINRSMAQRSDMEIYGVAEDWALPLEHGIKAGDCEDFVLEKRHALMAEGVPRSALSIAVVVTPQGISHAVLLVATSEGEYVLDSLTPWILPWQKTGYQWRERQVAGSTRSWAMVIGPAPLPTPTGDTPILLASAR